jgi:hypothetical protein
MSLLGHLLLGEYGHAFLLTAYLSRIADALTRRRNPPSKPVVPPSVAYSSAKISPPACAPTQPGRYSPNTSRLAPLTTATLDVDSPLSPISASSKPPAHPQPPARASPPTVWSAS